jgi:DNA helicase HerA-like ATPase
VISADPTRLGTVESVSGATVSVALEANAASGLTYVGGQGYRAGQVGNFARIRIGLLDLFGVISQIGAGAVPAALVEAQPHGHRWMSVELVGEALPGRPFQRGLSEYPTIGDAVFLLTDQDLDRLYGEPDELRHVRLGQLAGGGTVAARVDLDRLVTRHAAIVGATGSGKSSTVARLLSRVVDSDFYPGARVMLFDPHGEYAPALGHRATVFSASARPEPGQENLWVPFWALPLTQLLALTMGSLDEIPRAAVEEQVLELKRATLKRQEFKGIDPDTLTADTPIPFSLKQLWFTLHRRENATHVAPATGQSDNTEALLLDTAEQPVQAGDAARVVPPIYQPQVQGSIFLTGRGRQLRRPVDLLGQRLRDPRYAFLLQPGPFEPKLDGTVKKDLDALFDTWLGGSQPIALLDLAAVPAAVIDPLVGAIVNIVYEALLWSRGLSEGGRERPLLMVFEEAHTYLSRSDGGMAGEQVRRVVREGRKYGVGAVVVSQRPSELDETVLSQCGTLVALRLSNGSDRQQVTGAASENFQGMLANLPILRTGEAIVLGEAVRMPMRTQIDALEPDRQPNSRDPAVVPVPPVPGGWTRPRPQTPNYEAVAAAWRAQDPRGIGDQETPKVQREPVTSTALASIGYDASTMTLEVELRDSGAVYQYSDVPQSVHDELVNAQSLGSYYTKFIRNNYPYVRL